MSYPLSYSRAHTFDECPAKFKAEYLSKSGRSRNTESYLIVGNLIHELCDLYVKHLKDALQSSDFSEFDVIFERVWSSDLREGLSSSLRQEVYDLALIARDMLVFEDIRRVHCAEMEIAVDKDWRPVRYDDATAHVRGKIDRIDIDDEGNIKIVDYKSGHRIVGINDSYQVKLYARLARAHFPEAETIDVELDYFRHRSTRSGRVGPAEMESAEKWIESIGVDIEKAIKTGNYPARPGSACRGCSAFSICPARATTVKPVPPDDESMAVDLVRRLILIEREKKEIMEAIIPWVDQYGTIEVNDMALGYMKENRLEFDVARVATILEKRGLRPLKYMKVDSVAIRSLGRMDEKLAIELEKSARDSSATKLKLIIQGEDS